MRPSGQPPSSWDEALRAARQAPHRRELEQLLVGCRAYLLLVARQEHPTELKAKESPSDLVQQTLAEAHRDFLHFHGSSRAEWLAWLRRILLNNLHNLVAHYRRDRRDVARERASQAELPGKGARDLTSPHPTPQTSLLQAEQAAMLDTALAELPPDYREVIRLRHEEDLPFSEVGRRLGRSEDAAQKLWGRAVKELARRLRRRP
jgi:RNA polymerase sigma-70 factor (ECF subfamily)